MSKKRILVQDDEDMFRSPATVLLRGMGFEVDQATNGVEGLALLEKHEYTAVFSDIEMPNMNGIEFLARVRKNAKFAQVLVIMCTTLSKPEVVQKAKELGANGYIVKPMKMDNLKAALTHLKIAP